jgi:hypothetical protein
VESVAADSLFMQPAGYGVVIRDLVMVSVKGRVEASDLGQSRKFDEQGSDRRQIVRLMQRCKCRETLQPGDYPMVDQHGAIIVGTAMNDAMAHRERAHVMFVPQPGAGKHQGRRNIRYGLDRIASIRQRFASCAGSA